MGICASLSVPLPLFPFSLLDSQMDSSVNRNLHAKIRILCFKTGGNYKAIGDLTDHIL